MAKKARRHVHAIPTQVGMAVAGDGNAPDPRASLELHAAPPSILFILSKTNLRSAWGDYPSGEAVYTPLTNTTAKECRLETAVGWATRQSIHDAHLYT